MENNSHNKRNLIILDFDHTLYYNPSQNFTIDINFFRILPANYFFRQLTGQLFKSIRKLAIQNHFNLRILSGKYGLLEPDQIIEPYNQKINTKADIIRVRKTINPRITQIWRDYNIIIIIMGKNYREVLQLFFDNKFYVVYDRRGIGGYKTCSLFMKNILIIQKMKFLFGNRLKMPQRTRNIGQIIKCQ